MNPSSWFSTRTTPLWVVLAFIIGMSIYSQVTKYEVNSGQLKRDLATTYPKVPYEASYEQKSNSGLSILYLYCDGKGKVRLESTMPNSTAVSSTIVDFKNKKRYFLHEKQKTFMSDVLPNKGLAAFDEEMFKSMDAEKLGFRKYGNLNCIGYRSQLPGDKNAVVESWFDQKTKCLVSMNMPNSNSSATLTRMVARPPKPFLFEVPQGYKQSALPF